jgi:Kef-type K+ transport system membrane component KefB
VNLHFPPEGAEWTFFVCTVVILAGPLIAQRLRLPGMVGLVLGGVVVGPNVLDWVPREGVVEAIGQLGLLLLMFLAGLELDLDEFQRRRNEAVRFGLLTFGFPLVLGVVVAMAGFDFTTSAAILFGSLWASHTLVSYPIVRSRGLAGERPVSMAVSGTVITTPSRCSSWRWWSARRPARAAPRASSANCSWAF